MSICCICEDGGKDETINSVLLRCGHSFHLSCLEKRINGGSNQYDKCPQCQASYSVTKTYNTEKIIQVCNVGSFVSILITHFWHDSLGLIGLVLATGITCTLFLSLILDRVGGRRSIKLV